MNTSKSNTLKASAGGSTEVKHYDQAFKRQAVEHWIKTGKAGTRIAAELGVSYPTLKDWKRRYTGNALPVRMDLAAENRALKAELARVRQQRDILKKTLGIFVQPSSNATNGSTP
jgi:transposase